MDHVVLLQFGKLRGKKKKRAIHILHLEALGCVELA